MLVLCNAQSMYFYQKRQAFPHYNLLILIVMDCDIEQFQVIALANHAFFLKFQAYLKVHR